MNDKSLLVKVARLYYLDNLNQRAIAERLNMSMAGVSRALNRAKDEKIVEIHVHHSSATDDELESVLERTYGLRESAVVRTEGSEPATLEAMAHSLAGILSRVMAPGEVLGVSWGETLRGIADHLPGSGSLKADVIPIIGAMGMVETGVYPNSIATSLAKKLSGKAYLVNTPAVFSDRETRDAMMNDRTYRTIAGIWRDLQTAVVGVSGVSAEDSVARFEIFSAGELDSLQRQGVIAATNFDFLNVQGEQVESEIDERLIKIGFERLQAMKNVIVVAYGIRKVIPILAVLRSGVADVLITSQETAAELARPQGLEQPSARTGQD